MGLGLSIQTIVREWPTEDVPSVCSQCGSRLLLTRYVRLETRALPPDLAAQESEQLCGVCGAPACEEPQRKNESKHKQRLDFFKLFG